MPSMESAIFSPLNWVCPNCNTNYNSSSLNNITITRGTCSHDVCNNCITTLLNQYKLTKRKATRKVANASLIEISCPLDGCSRGRFLVKKNDGVNMKSGESTTHQEVIDVDLMSSDDEDKKQSSTQTKQTISIKKEVKKEKHTPAKRAAVSKEVTLNNSSKIVSPSPVKKKSELKPLFDVGNEVYAAWWSDSTKKGLNAWYPGKVKAIKAIGHSHYGPVRLYDIIFDDGDDIESLSDAYVFSKEDYLLKERLEKMAKTPKGVNVIVDMTSSDEWASIVGWYEVKIGKTKQLYSFLADAMKAYDIYIVRTKGNQAKRTDLNIPEDYPWLFEEEKKPYIKHDVKEEETDDDSKPCIKHEVKEEETDDDSRFSEGEPPASKRRRSDTSVTTDFWSTVANPVDFSRQAFMEKPLFHLNPGIDGPRNQNQWFNPFLREGLATIGFWQVSPNIAKEVPNWSYNQIRDAFLDEQKIKLTRKDSGGIDYQEMVPQTKGMNAEICRLVCEELEISCAQIILREDVTVDQFIYAVEGGGDRTIRAACQVAMWLKDATVGSFILMRHEFAKCPFIPSKLKINGKYIGKVYVIGVITKKVLPGSEEERAIQDYQMSEFDRDYNNLHSFCRVEWLRMGMKDTLDEATKKYINAVCQPTIARMCPDPSKTYKSGATGASVRLNLWENATTRIRSEDFNDVFYDGYKERRDV